MHHLHRFYQTRKKEILFYSFIVALIWIAHFLLSGSFGFYEDDWEFSGTAITNSLSDNLERIKYSISTFWQGRPLHMTFLTLAPFYGNKIGGINGIYFIGFILISINTILFYSLLKTSTNEVNIAIIASTLFCVYPADTTFKLLQHLIGIQPALMFLLIAFHLFIITTENIKFNNVLRTCSYLFACLSLLTYESLFLIFLTAPFLRQEPRNKKKYIYHCLIIGLILALYLTLRKLTGEERIQQFVFTEKMRDLLYQLFFGPIISLGTFIIRPLQMIVAINIQVLAVFVVSTFLFFIIFSQLLTKKISSQESNKHLKKTLRTLWLGLFMIVLAYPSALTLSVNTIGGRASRVHFSAILGSTIIVACLWNILLIKAEEKKTIKKIVILLISIHLSLLLLFSINVQESYKLSWQQQQSFWSDVISLAPDMEKHTVILVQAPQLAWGKQINPFDWSMPSVLKSIYNFPQGWDWSNEPRLYVVNSLLENPKFWQEKMIKNQQFILSSNNQGLRYYYSWEPEKIVNPKDIILLVEKDGVLVRESILNLPDGTSLALRQENGVNNVAKFKKNSMFYRLITRGDSQGIKKDKTIYFHPKP